MNKAATPSLVITNLIVLKTNITYIETKNFMKVSTLVHNFSPLLVCIEHFTDVHFKTSKKITFDDTPYIQ